MPLTLAATVIAIVVAAAQPPREATSLLGKPLVSPPVADSVRARLEADLAAARSALDRAPADPDARIWVGRRLAYLGRYRDAIAMFTAGVERFPGTRGSCGTADIATSRCANSTGRWRISNAPTRSQRASRTRSNPTVSRTRATFR